MTILPKRNKRRIDQRDQDSSQQLPQQQGSNCPASSLEPPTIHNSNHSTNQLHVEPSLSGHNHSQLGHFSGHPHAGLSQQRQTNAAYNNPMMIYNNHRPDNTLSLGTSTRAIAQATLTTSADTKWKRSPPMRPLGASSSDEKYVPAHKKTKRSKAKLKHGGGLHEFAQKLQDNQKHHTQSSVHGSSPSTYSSFLPNSSSSIQQSRQVLIPSGGQSTALPQLSPKMPGGAQHKSGTGRRSNTPDSGANSADEYQNTPSPSGCNSEDEHHVTSQEPGHSEELEKDFEHALKKDLGLVVRQMEMDGSCLFRAIADQVYGDQDMHDVVREHCIDYMAKNADHFSHYVTEDFATYLQRKRQLGCHGNHIEVQALSEMYNRPIEVYQYALKPMNIFHGSYRPEAAFPIRLTYHRNTHYNSLIDPEKPTIGVGLGLSDFKPRMVEKNLVAEAKTSSEDDQLEQDMLKDKLRETDWELTDEAINEQVSRESYAQWLQDCQKQKRRAPACTVTGPSCSSGTDETINWMEKLSPTGSPRQSVAHSPKSDREKTSSNSKNGGSSKKLDSACGGEQAGASSSTALNMSTETETFFDFEPFDVYNYNDNVDEGEAIARAITASQQDYISQVLKK